MLQKEPGRGKMLTVRDGYLICPHCRRNQHVRRIVPETTATMLLEYCRSCKTEFYIDISKGQCYESRSQ